MKNEEKSARKNELLQYTHEIIGIRGYKEKSQTLFRAVPIGDRRRAQNITKPFFSSSLLKSETVENNKGRKGVEMRWAHMQPQPSRADTPCTCEKRIERKRGDVEIVLSQNPLACS